MTERTAGSLGGLPSSEQVIELLDGEFARAGYEIENVTVDTRTAPPRIVIVVDGDAPLDLDTAAELARSASDRMDTVDTGPTAYLLEVTSPGVERPLTQEKHFRRARGRKVELELADGASLTGRLGAITDGVIDVVVRDRTGWAVRPIPLTGISKAVVQVEFSPPSAKERELAGLEATNMEGGA